MATTRAPMRRPWNDGAASQSAWAVPILRKPGKPRGRSVACLASMVMTDDQCVPSSRGPRDQGPPSDARAVKVSLD